MWLTWAVVFLVVYVLFKWIRRYRCACGRQTANELFHMAEKTRDRAAELVKSTEIVHRRAARVLTNAKSHVKSRDSIPGLSIPI